jgi:hypothetical protein
MDARPLLFKIAKMLEERGLEAVLIGNAAAALQRDPQQERSGPVAGSRCVAYTGKGSG